MARVGQYNRPAYRDDSLPNTHKDIGPSSDSYRVISIDDAIYEAMQDEESTRAKRMGIMRSKQTKRKEDKKPKF